MRVQRRQAHAPTAPTDPRIYIRAKLDEYEGAAVTVVCGAARIEMTFTDPRRPIPVDETDKQLITMVIAQLLMRGVSRGRIRSSVGRLAVYALAKHVRFSMESDAPIHDFGGLPVVAELPRKRAQLVGITAVVVT